MFYILILVVVTWLSKMYNHNVNILFYFYFTSVQLLAGGRFPPSDSSIEEISTQI